jgi:N-carbamoylputrescine amidase
MIGHAVANAVGVVAANRIGVEGGMTFYGSSFVCDARGDKLAELARDRPGIALATLDLEQIRRVRTSMGFFRDRRPELYRRLTD